MHVFLLAILRQQKTLPSRLLAHPVFVHRLKRERKRESESESDNLTSEALVRAGTFV